MTLLVAMHATDGIVALSDRKEIYPLEPPRDVKKYYLDGRGRFYISLAGDGKLAEVVLRNLARARTGPSDVRGRIRDIVKKLPSKTRRKDPRADGFLITVEQQRPRLYSISIGDGRVDVFESRVGASAHGDGRAKVLFQYIAKKASHSGMQCREAAWHLHVLASDVAEHVESVGRRDEYGFDLALFVTASGTRLPERDMEWHGRIDVRFRPAAQAAPPATRGGGVP